MDNPNFRFVKESITDREAVYRLFEEEHPDMECYFILGLIPCLISCSGVTRNDLPGGRDPGGSEGRAEREAGG